MVDKDEYPQTPEIETRCVRMLADLWQAPDAKSGVGTLTTGLSEAAMLGGLAMKRRWEAGQRTAEKPADRPNIIAGPVQIFWHKLTRCWNTEYLEIPMENRRLPMTPKEVLARCDENTIGVVPTLVATFAGQSEPIIAVSHALDTFQADTGLDIPIHVDGATGKFPAPFCAPDLEWDFRLPRVRRVGHSGYDQVHDACCEIAQFLAAEIARIGAVDIVYGGASDAGIPCVCWTIPPGTDHGFSLIDFADRLRARGWQVPAYTLAANQQETAIQRIFVHSGVSHDLASLFLDGMRDALAHLDKHPVKIPRANEDASAFLHCGTS